MASRDDPRKAQRDRLIDESLKQVFSELEADKMPDEIIDLLSVLKAQDKELKDRK